MKSVIKKSLLAATVAGIVASPVANATNGYFMHGYSTKEKGVAGAGTAYSQDSMAAATNPAGMAFVGERLDIGLMLFSPSPRSYTLTGTPVATTSVNATPGAEVESDNDIFLIPHFGYNWQLSNDTTAGISIYGNGGMNTEYPTSSTTPFPDAGTFGDGVAGVNLEQMFFNFSFTKKISAKHAFGGSLLLVGQRFTAQGVGSFAPFSLDPANMSSNKKDVSFGAGLKVGYQGEVSDGIRVGIAYQSRISMDEFEEYSGLFAEGGDFDIPSTYNIGISFDVGSSSVIVADVQQINYSDVAAISNPIQQLINGSCNPSPAFGGTGPAGAGCLGGAAGAGFGWEDMTIFKIGYQIDINEKHTFRVGYSHADQPIPENQTLFNILAPAVIEDHITAGWTMKIGDSQEFNLSAMYAPSNSVKGDNPFDGGSTQIEIEMSQWDVQAGWAWKY
jgi:long-chain fatty acid transport protein